MNKPLDKSALTVLTALANAPVDETFKRGVAMLLQSSRARQLADAEIVMSDNDVIARREQLEKVDDLGERWTALRDDCAAMLNRFDADASDLGRAEENVREMLQTMQDAIRLSFAREYIP